MTKSKESTKRNHPLWAKIVATTMWVVFLLGTGTVIALFALIAQGKLGYMPPIEELENPKNKFASEIYSDDLKVLGRYYQSQENRVFVNYNELSPHLVRALIATEDVRFTQHSGIDLKSLFRAIIKRGVLGQKSAGGGSTITQQLAKQLYSPQANSLLERAMQKPIEWVIAVKLERFYTKEEIINMYLNKFDFLYNAVGIQSAATIYFGLQPKELSLEQSAMLIGMCKNPSYFNPVRYEDRTRGRRNTVLQLMVTAGYISEQECKEAQQLPIALNFSRVDHKQGAAPYLREHLRLMMTAKEPIRKNYRGWQQQEFVDDSTAWHNNPLYGWCNKNRKPDGSHYNLYTDGLKIYTTLNSRMQQYAEEAVSEHIGKDLQPKFDAEKRYKSNAPFSKDITPEEMNTIIDRAIVQSDRYRNMQKEGTSKEEILKSFDQPVSMQLFSWGGTIDTTMTPRDSIRYQKSFLRSGFMSMEATTGHVKAYVGGINFNNFQYNMVSKGRRQVGSTIKPFLYTLAMEEGFSPCDLAPNVQPKLLDENGNLWEPRNSSDKRVGEMVTLRWGLTNSNNWISAYLMNQLSPYNFVKLLHSFGIKSHIDPVISLCLGTADVSVEEMVTAYSAFANKGIRVDPLLVSRIEDNQGNIIAEFTPNLTEVFSESAYTKMMPILQNVVNEGTAVRLRFKYGITAEMGAKTGTTNNHSDGWFMAVTPSLVSGVWVGGEERSIHFDSMVNGQGANMALPIYALYINKVYADPTLGYSQEEKFDSIPGVVVPPCEEVFQLVTPTQSGIEGIFD